MLFYVTSEYLVTELQTKLCIAQYVVISTSWYPFVRYVCLKGFWHLLISAVSVHFSSTQATKFDQTFKNVLNK